MFALTAAWQTRLANVCNGVALDLALGAPSRPNSIVMIARTIFIEGKVQGVFYRDWTVDLAHEMGISGWVRNRRDGRVEVFAIGKVELINRFINRLREGSPASRVDAIYSEEAPMEPIKGFARRQSV